MNSLVRSAAALAAALVVSLTAPPTAVAGPARASSDYRAVASEVMITNLTPPRIIGTPAYGNVLTADVGTWSTSEDLTYQYRWTVNPDSTFFQGDDPTYKPLSGYIGKKLYLRIYAFGYVNGERAMGEAISAPVTVTPARTTITATAPKVVEARRKFTIKVHIADPSASIWGTDVRVSHKKRPLASSGTIYTKASENPTEMDVKIVVADYNGRWLPVGIHTLRVRFSGSNASNAPADSLPSSTTVKIKVVKRS